MEGYKINYERFEKKFFALNRFVILCREKYDKFSGKRYSDFFGGNSLY